MALAFRIPSTGSRPSEISSHRGDLRPSRTWELYECVLAEGPEQCPLEQEDARQLDSFQSKAAVVDESAGYEEVAEEVMAQRSASRIGAQAVREWAAGLPAGAAVLDLGCGHGVPISEVLIDEGHRVYGIDASPTLVAAFRRHFPGMSVECAPVQSSGFFERKFEGVVAWGLAFLLPPGEQTVLIQRVSNVLTEGGQFLFTAPRQFAEWEDVLTGRTSISIGADGYRAALEEAGLVLVDEREDEGDNYYFLAAGPG